MPNVLVRLWDALRHTGPVKSDYRVTYQDGPVIEWVERGSTTRWYIDGVRVSKEAAQARTQEEDAARRQDRPGASA
jgi:hypothetical protein